MSLREFAGRFRTVQEVALGGMGRVDAAFDPVIGRRVAIKTLRDEFGDDDLALEKFADEARITGQLEHPNVVPIYDLGGGGGSAPFIVMRLIEGRSLTALLDQAAVPATSIQAGDLLRRFVQILLAVCDGVAFAHSRGVFHCDLKPDNVMVGDHGQVYLLDWGVALTARLRDGSGGTAAYMAPEQILRRTEDIDARTDVYGLGGILYQVLTGSPPNDASNLLALTWGERPLSFEPGALWSTLPPELCRIARRALSYAPAARYPEVAAFRADLEQFLKGGGWFDTVQVKAGETIVTEGESGKVAYIIQSGNCEVWKMIHGEGRMVRKLGAGDVFGETAVFAGGTRTATIVAANDVTLRVITGDALNRELDQNPVLAAFVRSLANLFRETDAVLSARGEHVSSLPPNVKT